MNSSKHVWRKFVASLPLMAAVQANLCLADCLFPYWQNLNPPQSPTGYRVFHQMAYDSERRITVLFGGTTRCWESGSCVDTDFYDDTWEFDGNTWTLRFPGTTPFPLVMASMSYDPVKRVSIMFGGNIRGFTTLSGVLWEWDGNDWEEVSIVGPRPQARRGHKMAYDSARRVHVMYGGFVPGQEPGGSGRPATETWDYDALARTWTLRSTNGPSARERFDLAFDPVRNRTVLFGGSLATAPTLADSYANDTWVWDGDAGTWQQLNPANKPSGRFGHAMAFDSTRHVVVLLGGEYVKERFPDNGIVSAYSGETWTWDGSNWANQSLYPDFCCGVSDLPMVYETARQQLFLFGDTNPTNHHPMLNWVAATGNGRSLNYVDWSNPFLEDGSIFFPFRTVRTAVSCTLGAATISIRGGDYAEGFQQITKQMNIIANNGAAHIH
jgi:hypothetical protein